MKIYYKIQWWLHILKWNISWIPSMFGISCANCKFADGGVCPYAGEISSDWWCFKFRK